MYHCFRRIFSINQKNYQLVIFSRLIHNTNLECCNLSFLILKYHFLIFFCCASVLLSFESFFFNFIFIEIILAFFCTFIALENSANNFLEAFKDLIQFIIHKYLDFFFSFILPFNPYRSIFQFLFHRLSQNKDFTIYLGNY